MSLAWETLAKAIELARADIAAHAPDEAVAAEGEAYLMRLVAAALNDACLAHLRIEGGLLRALPTKGGPNPHYIILSARIDPAYAYRLEGWLNASERVGVGLYALGDNGAPLEVGYASFDETTTLEDGGFSLELKPGAAGQWALSIPPDCRLMIARILHRASGTPASLFLHGGELGQVPALAGGTAENALAAAARAVTAAVREYLKWTRAVAAKPNCFAIPPPELAATVQGDRDTAYTLGYYDLAKGEWLEVSLPQDRPGYWSIHAYNHWFESVNSEGAHDRNTVPDEGGALRVRVGPQLPADLVNRLETHGRHRGALICRILGASDVSVPAARVMKLPA